MVATCQDGVFTYIGLPTKFLPKVQPDECLSCQETERCALVQTRAMKNRERMLENFSRWSNSIKKHTSVFRGQNLLDHHYEPRMSLTLSKRVYDKWCARFFKLENLFTAVCILTSLEMFSLQMWATMEEVRREAWGLLLRSAQKHYSEGIPKMRETTIHSLMVTDLRLASHTARGLYKAPPHPRH